MKGLINFGNTCYFNTALQCLLNTPALSNRLLSKGYSGDCEFTNEYYSLVYNYWTNKERQWEHPGKVLKLLTERYKQFVPGEPNDVQEVVLCVIDMLEKSLGKEWVQSVFYGETRTIVNGDKKLAERTEKFACMPLDVGVSYFEQETEVSDFKDDSGKVWPNVKVRTITSAIGPIFMVSFNQYNEKKRVNVPEEFQFGGHTYKVYAVAIHIGSHMGGHYAALICRKSKWYLADDIQVVEVPRFEPTGSYYFAMYKRATECKPCC
jgi:ubiquitin C-terminal hydrolase